MDRAAQKEIGGAAQRQRRRAVARPSRWLAAGRSGGDVRFGDQGPEDHDGEDSLDRDEDCGEHGPEELHENSVADDVWNALREPWGRPVSFLTRRPSVLGRFLAGGAGGSGGVAGGGVAGRAAQVVAP